jgi:phospholipid/cholesterol/gamma-HCH transport system substrate-binding protein
MAEDNEKSGVSAGRAKRAVRVGSIVLVAVVVLAVAVFLIGQENNLFSRKNRYFVDLKSVSGIKPGNPVELDGVSVGAVDRVILPRDPKKGFIQVWMKVDRQYGHRVRADSLVRIKTLGLLGDKFLELNSGSPEMPEIRDEGRLNAAPSTNVDALIASGTDVMDNISTISFQLKNILSRVDRGQGLLGELTSDSEPSRRLKANIFATLDTIQRVANKVDTGPGPLPRLLNDRALADSLADSVASLHTVLASVQNGKGLIPGLLNDPTTRQQYDETIASLRQVVQDLRKFSGDLENGKGLVPRLVNDEAYARQITDNVRQMVERLNGVAGKLSEGGGTAGKVINDPQIYDSVNDILIGINDSWMLRWLIRNRQKAGIKHRYHDVRDEMKEEKGEDASTAPRRRSDEKQSDDKKSDEKPSPEPDSTPAPPPVQSTEPVPQGTEPVPPGPPA